MSQPDKFVSDANHSIVLNTPDNEKVVTFLQEIASLNEQFAYDITNTLHVIKDLAVKADSANPEETAAKLYQIVSLINLLIPSVVPEQFHELQSFLQSLKITNHGNAYFS